MKEQEVLSVILGGGRGTRLYPLTKYRAKPAVPLAGKYRLIDVPISNCLNSGLRKIFVLTQFNSASLNRHISRAYQLDRFSGGFVEILAADQSMDNVDWFQGTADAVRRCLRHFSAPNIKYILILSGDQLYKMDLREMMSFHEEKKSEVTLACNVVDKSRVSELGVIGINKSLRVKHFVEKPKELSSVSHLAVNMDGKERYLASMGIYLFNKDVLIDMLTTSHKADFGKEIIPDAFDSKVTHGYIFNGYWEDIGSIESFYRENLAFAGNNPPFDLYDENWHFFTRSRHLPSSKILNSQIENSTVAEGVMIQKAKISNSVIGLRSRIGSGSVIEDSVIMGCDYYENACDVPEAEECGVPALGVGHNCHIKMAILDKNVRIGDNVKIVNKHNRQDCEDEYCTIRNGITIVPKGSVIPSGTVI